MYTGCLQADVHVMGTTYTYITIFSFNVYEYLIPQTNVFLDGIIFLYPSQTQDIVQLKHLKTVLKMYWIELKDI